MTVKIPKALVDYIKRAEWFKIYGSLEEFVLESVRVHRGWIELGSRDQEGTPRIS